MTKKILKKPLNRASLAMGLLTLVGIDSQHREMSKCNERRCQDFLLCEARNRKSSSRKSKDQSANERHREARQPPSLPNLRSRKRGSLTNPRPRKKVPLLCTNAVDFWMAGMCVTAIFLIVRCVGINALFVPP